MHQKSCKKYRNNKYRLTLMHQYCSGILFWGAKIRGAPATKVGIPCKGDRVVSLIIESYGNARRFPVPEVKARGWAIGWKQFQSKCLTSARIYFVNIAIASSLVATKNTSLPLLLS